MSVGQPVNIKRHIISAVSVMLVLLTSCGRTQVTEPSQTTPETTVQRIMMSTEPRETEPQLPIFLSIDYSIKEPEIEDEEGQIQYITFYRDGNPIQGKITHPEGKGPFKTIVISGGLYSHFGRYSNKAQSYSEKGYAVIEFQFQNGTPPDSYADPEYLGDFIFEQVLDLYAVIDSLEYISYVDTSNIYLYGHSMGGLVTSYAGTLRQSEIKGLILVDPSFYAADIMHFEHKQTITTNIYSLISKCMIPTVIITGTEGSFGEDPHFFDEARAALPDCEYVVIDGAGHRMEGEASEKVVERSVEVMKKWDARDN